jgi:hypothetical protein
VLLASPYCASLILGSGRFDLRSSYLPHVSDITELSVGAGELENTRSLSEPGESALWDLNSGGHQVPWRGRGVGVLRGLLWDFSIFCESFGRARPDPPEL